MLSHFAPGQKLNLNLLEPISRTLINEEGLEVLCLALTAGKKIPTHAVDAWVQIQGLAGVFAVNMESQRLNIAAGEMVLLAPGQPHSVECRQTGRLLVNLLKNRSYSKSK